MIPKIIHYCWFGEAEKSTFIKNCIKSWKKFLPDYEVRCWSEKNFDVLSNEFVKQAYEKKKWAFVADYTRFYALYKEGGVYFDTDVKVLKPFPDIWFHYDFFSAHEVHPNLFYTDGIKKLDETFLPLDKEEDIDGFSILSAIMGARSKHPFLKDCMELYHNMSFLNDNSSIRKTNEVIIGAILGKVAIEYKYKYVDKKQILRENMLILPSNVLVGNSEYLDYNSFAIHLINGSWTKKKGFEKFLYQFRNNFPKIFPFFYFFVRAIRKILRVLKVN